MVLIDQINNWNNKKILVIGEALLDKYITGFADKISPDAPVPNIKIEEQLTYLGGIGLVIKIIKSLGGVPEICTIVGNDYEGQFFLNKVNELNIDSTSIIFDNTINTPQITRIKAMNQHLIRLETDYSQEISQSTIDKFLYMIQNKLNHLGAILILDYGIGGLFNDLFIQRLINLLKKFNKVPILVRPNLSNYYVYEKVDMIKITLQKALRTFSIDCCNETSISIVGKKINNTCQANYVLLNDVESNSFLFYNKKEEIEKFPPILKTPVRSYVAVGSTIMAVLGLCFAANLPVSEGVKIALYAASLTASLPPVEFYESKKLIEYIQAN